MNDTDRKRYPTLRPLVPTHRRPLLRSLVNGRPAPIARARLAERNR